ncbi:MAG: histidine phosphatase family protein [Thermoplasmata archaeon]|nr:histidine phosphatase family protein [Thermoplasmata archaeon]
MRGIDYRRHAQRDPGGVHLNANGIATARRVAASSGPYARVLSSPLPRAAETAQIVGGRVAELRRELATLEPGVESALGPIVRWSDYGASARRSPTVARYAERQASALQRIADTVPEGGQALVVSHGMILELGAIGALPELDTSAWGGPAGYCEGIRLEYEGGRCVAGTILRVG